MRRKIGTFLAGTLYAITLSILVGGATTAYSLFFSLPLLESTMIASLLGMSIGATPWNRGLEKIHDWFK